MLMFMSQIGPNEIRVVEKGGDKKHLRIDGQYRSYIYHSWMRETGACRVICRIIALARKRNPDEKIDVLVDRYVNIETVKAIIKNSDNIRIMHRSADMSVYDPKIRYLLESLKVA